MKIEYLIITKQDAQFCNTREAFLGFLGLDADIAIGDETITYTRANEDGSLVVNYTLETSNIPGKEERYFHLTLVADQDIRKSHLVQLANRIRELAQRLNPESTRINTLWNEVGRGYAVDAYPKINEVENLMRKLITKFLLINVGMEWSKVTIHREILEQIERRQGEGAKDIYRDVLYKTDFIQLSEVLFRKYRSLGLDELDRILSAERLTEDNIDKIRTYLPRSNWERYFSEVIDYDGERLRDKWGILYELRNDVAHNRYIDEADLGKIRGLTRDIKQVLIETIDKLDHIELSEEDKTNVIDSYKQYPFVSERVAVEAVCEWYRKQYPDAHFPEYRGSSLHGSLHIPMDFVIELNSQVVGVDVKYVTHLAHSQHILERRLFEQGLMWLADKGIDEYHLVFVLSLSPAVYSLVGDKARGKFMQRVWDFEKMSKPIDKMKIVFGVLNADKTFSPLQRPWHWTADS